MLIKLGKLSWGNVFSYGEYNEIDFSASPLVQLVGKNGHGKSSIGLILELVLYNKNSKNIKTADIINRNNGAKSYWIKLDFEKGSDKYHIHLNRTSSQTVKLIKNGDDISSHTPTNTFKMIEEIVEIPHKKFPQLINQTSIQALEFLTDTDSGRKKFLMDLLDLGEYTVLFELLKEQTKLITESVRNIEGKLSASSSWLEKNSSKDLSMQVHVDQPEAIVGGLEKVAELKETINNIVKTNKQISDNNKYRELRDSIDVDAALAAIVKDVENDKPLVERKAVLNKVVTDGKSLITKVSKLHSNCPTCSAPLDNSKSIELANKAKVEVAEAEKEISELTEKISKIQKIIQSNEKNSGLLTAFERHNESIRDDLPKEILSKSELEDKVIALTFEIEKRDKEIRAAIKHNREVDANNASVQAILSQMKEMQEDLDKYKSELAVVNKRLSIVQILQKAFSPSGLPAFKIENSIKGLEVTVNEYLAEMSSGRFQLSFVMSGEKLNVVVTDNGHDIEMASLSSGERARVNTATLLAIRKTMQQMSNVKVNLLILDEVIENLDSEGKDKFIEILMKETHLNTILVSHSYSHPLLEKILIVKENNISRIEHD